MPRNFFCPACKKSNVLTIVDSIELPEHTQFDEVLIQLIQCLACNMHGMAIYEESRRGNLENETINHYGYWLEPNAYENLKKMLVLGNNEQENKNRLAKLTQYYKNKFTDSEIRPDLSTHFCLNF